METNEKPIIVGCSYETPNHLIYISKRDYFAAMALQGILTAGIKKDYAKIAVKLANDLIAELDKKEKNNE